MRWGRRNMTVADGLIILTMLFFFLGVLLIPLFMTNPCKPEVMVGLEGLTQTKRYCGMLVLSHLISALLIPAGIELCALIRRKLDDGALLSLMWRIPIEIILCAAYLLMFPRSTYVELQSQLKHDSGTLFRAAELYFDTAKDLDKQETAIQKDISVTLQQFDFKYTYQRRSGGRYSRPKTETAHEYEYGICNRAGKAIAQITVREYKSLQNTAFEYNPHTLTIYKNSGLLAAIDGADTVPNTKQEDLVKLTYDYDAGVIRRELLCENEEAMPTMYLHIELDSAEFGEESGSREIVNGKTMLAFKPMVPGTGRAWVEMVTETGERVRVSNIIEYEQTEYVAAVLPVRGAHIAQITQQGDHKLLTDATYHFTLTYPAELALNILDVDAEDTGFGTDRTLVKTADNDTLMFGLYALERPWSRSYSEAYEVPLGIDSEMDSRKLSLKKTRDLLREYREGEWRVQEWTIDDVNFAMVAMYPLTDLQYLECRFTYHDLSTSDTARSILKSITVTGSDE